MFNSILRQNVIEDRLLNADAAFVCLVLENLAIGSVRGRFNSRAVSHSSQERLVREILLFEVRREHDELLEWNLDLLASVQRKIINASFQRHDPTIEKILRSDALTTEVVDHERSTVGLHLEWRFVKLSVTPRQVGILQSQFTTDHHQRPFDKYPTTVVLNRR